TARETLSRLEDRGEIASRKASVIRLFYVPANDHHRDHEASAEGDTASESISETDDSDSDTETENFEDVFGSVEFLTDAQIEYLRDGTLSECVEPHILDRLAE